MEESLVKMSTKRNKSPGAQGGTGEAGRRSTSFVMTLWLEPTDRPDQPEWRWRVTEIQTGEQRYFRRLTDLLTYVSERAGVSPPT